MSPGPSDTSGCGYTGTVHQQSDSWASSRRSRSNYSSRAICLARCSMGMAECFGPNRGGDRFTNPRARIIPGPKSIDDRHKRRIVPLHLNLGMSPGFLFESFPANTHGVVTFRMVLGMAVPGRKL